jgi:hypothetical protein
MAGWSSLDKYVWNSENVMGYPNGEIASPWRYTTSDRPHLLCRGPWAACFPNGGPKMRLPWALFVLGQRFLFSTLTKQRINTKECLGLLRSAFFKLCSTYFSQTVSAPRTLFEKKRVELWEHLKRCSTNSSFFVELLYSGVCRAISNTP